MSEYVTPAACAESMAELEREVQSLVSLGEGVPEISLEVEVSGMTAYPTDKTLSIEDMPADAKKTGDEINDLQADLADVALDVDDIKSWTGSDIPLTASESSPTIAQAIANITSDAYPVGSIYMTTSDSSPSFSGTWVEIAITATFVDIKTGKRGYQQLGQGATGGDVHFWLRTA